MGKLFITISILLMTACSPLRGKVDYSKPSENFIDINGTIAESLTYKVKVQYVTGSESEKCKNYNWMAGMHVSQQTEIEYRPVIENERHSLHIPLKALDPRTECNWAPSVVFLCVNAAGKEPGLCSSLFFLRGEHDNHSAINIECDEDLYCFRKPFELHTEDINILNTTYVVNIGENSVPAER